MTDAVAVLQTSVRRLRGIVERLDPSRLEAQAFPTEWTIADVLSHLGSGAVILQRRFDDAVAGSETPPEFAQPIWDVWNAKTPEAQATDALIADQAFVDRVGSLTDEEQSRFEFSMGPMTLDFAGFVGLRLNEHALHTWDIEVTLDPHAPVAQDATRLVVDNLQMITRFTGKPIGTERNITVHTTEPQRDFTITVRADAVSLEPTEGVDEPDLEIPAEAFVRLVYGRMDPDHTPPTRGPADLDELRRIFPGP
jgi:uncharacterized protein (TIGR03083 family)